MRLTDIPVFFIAAPITAPTPAIAVSSVTAANTIIAELYGLRDITGWVCDYGTLLTANLILHGYLSEEVTLYDNVASVLHKTLLFLLQKAFCEDKVRHHDEHLAGWREWIILLECEFRSPIGDLISKPYIK
ncbi:uncharacterized protein EV154DRAFT_488557 [Mucor mucedo]|uniref:uncharacterized protein n=1 Tax=Mucor mucedo TaxID=29922 RepID=UPI00222038F2|nr:uncharacterized protein EV154DRAFT_488557 [Mucor mucedo]KAI7866385.1 hypothetical protein EV154DRAFT_488557 [Mucor mucedo]